MYSHAHAATYFQSGEFKFVAETGDYPWTNNTWTLVETTSGIEHITPVGNTTAATLEVQDPEQNGNFMSGSYLFTQAQNFGGTGNQTYINTSKLLSNDEFIEYELESGNWLKISTGWRPDADVYTADGWYVSQANQSSWYTGPVQLSAIPFPIAD
jgi:hypothetical protein